MEGSSTGAYPSAVPPHPIELCLENLKAEVLDVVRNETAYKEKIQELAEDLAAYKHVLAAVNAELAAVNTELADARRAQQEAEAATARLEEEVRSYKNQDKGHRIVMLLDGDGAIFSAQFIAQGQKGGHAAAQRLADATFQHIAGTYGPRVLQLWVYVFFNKRGLLDAFRRAGLAALAGKFDDFVMGFNQATERFLMVDVGTTKEAADAKLKAYLEDEIRLPETYKIVFGGCHDNGYLTSLHSAITSGFKEKLVLLKSYTEMAAGIAALDLPAFAIPELFMPHKIGAEDPAFSPQSPRDMPSSASDTPSTSSTPLSGGVPPGGAPRAYNANLPIGKQKPAVCTLHYMKDRCKFGAACKFAHDYVLTAAQRDELAKFAKKAPCPSALQGAKCKFGDTCCYGHVCPYSPNCFFQKQGKCKFRQADMHAPAPARGG
ncbi:hypothetical protein B0H15DRAFT_139397 [Mycena belliarum]|uniref:C3H1-type domain-containing protein n=1 Tax=Mycena belliarum TaxID=1033014 RepID=A0AAD6XDS5_9AGAR|nr:hypothetical protein B0H15DRAFT_139397 [Mycena belliae]